jgi:molybdenum cofactor cytidylyltransferase
MPAAGPGRSPFAQPVPVRYDLLMEQHSEQNGREAEALIPAAGLSSRMESWKPLLPYGDGTLIEQAVANALAVCHRVILVTGYRGEELERLFEGERRVTCIRNREYRRGMFSSLQHGVAEVRAPRFFVAMGDMPDIPPSLYGHLLEEPPADVVRPRYRGIPGHPVLFAAGAARLIRSLPPEADMGRVLSSYEVREINVDEPGCVQDIDTIEEYRGRVGTSTEENFNRSEREE